MLLQGPVSSWHHGRCSNQGSSTTVLNFQLYTELCRMFFHSLFFPVGAITANNGHLSDNISLPKFSSDPLSSPQMLSQSFFKDFFFMQTVFKVFIGFVTISLLFYASVWPGGMSDLSSLTRDRTSSPYTGRRLSLNHWMTREVPQSFQIEAYYLRK